MGLGIWSMHYIGMLAYRLPIPVAYNVPTVLLSLVAAIVASALALAIVSRPTMRNLDSIFGGAAMGIGIASMHYIGMDAMRMRAMCIYQPWGVALSVLIAIGISIIALHLAFRLRGERRSFSRAKLAGAVAMGSAIPLMHYSGMAAVTFVAAPMVGDQTFALQISSLALANIVGVTAIVLSGVIVIAAFDRHWADQVRELARRQESLDNAVDVASKRVRRIEALARVARETELLSYDERAQAILDIASAMIRPGRPTLGVLSHLDRETILVDKVSPVYGATPAAFDRVSSIIYPGSTFPLEHTMHVKLYQSGKTLAWDEIDAASVAPNAQVCDEFGVRSLIGTPVQIGARTHFVLFDFLQTNLDDPFVDEDIAFVDVVASFLANGYQRQLQADRLRYQMEHDAMTGLGNRIQFRSAVMNCVQTNDRFAIVLLNLDHFREFNVAHGHLIADELLVEVATELAAVDDRDLVVRLNGDEFSILMRGADAGDIDARLARYANLFETPFNTGDRDGTRLLTVTGSFGAALFSGEGATTEEVSRQAEVALELAKEQGGGRALIFDDEMRDALSRRWIQRSEIERALAEDEFELWYQPTFDLTTRSVAGAEALIRWRHPQRGLVMPSEFIPFAERMGMIAKITSWVFDRLVLNLTENPAIPPGVRCSMNLSARQLNDAVFAKVVHDRLDAHPALAGRITFEITESSTMLNVQSSIFALGSFRQAGIHIAIDDFGTGFSSLSYLKHLPADVIKIDQSFVRGIPSDAMDVILVDTFVWLANAFGFASLAEGIETEEQLDWLREHGCAYGQGFLVSPALPLGEFCAFAHGRGIVTGSDASGPIRPLSYGPQI